jgi:hypothetical protein
MSMVEGLHVSGESCFSLGLRKASSKYKEVLPNRRKKTLECFVKCKVDFKTCNEIGSNLANN